MSVDSKPRKLNLGWLTPPAPSTDGTMELIDHLKELRYRVTMAAIGVVLATAGAMFFYRPLLRVVLWPMNTAIATYKANTPDADVIMSTSNVTGGFMLLLKVSLMAGLIASCPIWLWQLWVFIMPGLLANEKKYAVRFLGSAIPLFLLGICVGYVISPKGFAVMLQFNPPTTTNINDLSGFFAFQLRMLLVFGLSFLLPVVLVALNMLGVMKATMLAKGRKIAIFTCFVFGAIATPSVDPFSMLALSLPMVLMYLISELICRANDKRKAAKGELVLVDDVSVD